MKATMWDMDIGICYTFNFNHDNSRSIAMQKESGRQHGLKLILWSDTSETYYSPLISGQNGFRV